MRSLQFLSFLFLFSILQGCFKNDPGGLTTTVNVIAVDRFSRDSLAEVPFEIERCSSNGLFGFCNPEEFLQSDSNGFATHTFVTEKNNDYKLNFSTNNDLRVHLPTVYHPIREGQVNNIVFELNPICILSINYKHASSNDIDLTSSIRRNTDNDLGYTAQHGYGGTHFKDLQQDIDTIIYELVAQGEEYTLKNTLNKQNGETELLHQTFEVDMQDTIELIVEF